MNIFKKILLILFLITIPIGVQGQTKPVLVADINIQGVKLINQTDNVFNIEFNLKNCIGVQSGVKYSIKLISKDGKNTTIDEFIYKESLTLTENTNVKRNIIYQAPKYLSGTYNMYLFSNNESGFPFGIAFVKEVKLEAIDDFAQIDNKTCKISIDTSKNKNDTHFVYSLGANQNLRLDCIVINNTKTDLVLSPKYEIKQDSSYGNNINFKGGDTASLSIKSGEKKTVSLLLPRATKPGNYFENIYFVSGEKQTNKISIVYKIIGENATISNVSSDKDYYKGGDIAKFTIILDGSAQNAKAEIIIKNDKDFICGEEKLDKIEYGLQELNIKINKACFDPQIDITIKSSDGNVLDHKITKFKTLSVKKDEVVFGGKNGLKILLAIILLVIAIAIFMRKKKVNTSTIVGVLLFGICLLSPISKADASTYMVVLSTGNRINLNINIDNLTPNPVSYPNFVQGETIGVDGYIYSNNMSKHYLVTLDAITIGNNTVNIFDSPSLIGPTNNYVWGAPKSFVVNTPSNGNYNVDYTMGAISCEDNIIIPGSPDYNRCIVEGSEGTITMTLQNGIGYNNTTWYGKITSTRNGVEYVVDRGSGGCLNCPGLSTLGYVSVPYGDYTTSDFVGQCNPGYYPNYTPITSPFTISAQNPTHDFVVTCSN